MSLFSTRNPVTSIIFVIGWLTLRDEMQCWFLAGSSQGATVPFKGWALSAEVCYAGTVMLERFHRNVLTITRAVKSPGRKNTQTCCIFRSGLWGHEETDLYLRVVMSSKSFLLVSQFDRQGQAMGKARDAENTRFLKDCFKDCFTDI